MTSVMVTVIPTPLLITHLEMQRRKIQASHTPKVVTSNVCVMNVVRTMYKTRLVYCGNQLEIDHNLSGLISFFIEGNRRGQAPYRKCIKSKNETFVCKKGRKAKAKAKDQTKGGLNYIQPNFHGIDHLLFHSMQQEGKF
jgi:hypothetical protein